MALDLGKIKVDIEIGTIGRVLVTATQLHDAIYHLPEGVASLPDSVQHAFTDLYKAIQALKS